MFIIECVNATKEVSGSACVWMTLCVREWMCAFVCVRVCVCACTCACTWLPFSLQFQSLFFSRGDGRRSDSLRVLSQEPQNISNQMNGAFAGFSGSYYKHDTRFGPASLRSGAVCCKWTQEIIPCLDENQLKERTVDIVNNAKILYYDKARLCIAFFFLIPLDRSSSETITVHCP